MSELAVISLGAGTQSTTLLLMACAGLVEPQPVEAVFADTDWEPKAVYRHLDWLDTVSSIPISRVRYGNIKDDALHKPMGVNMPFYLTGQRGPGIMRRQCTYKYKLAPIRRRVRELMHQHGSHQVAQMMVGISLDEIQRMRDSDVRYMRNAYPLIDLRMTRVDCLLWLERHGFPRPPKSACIGCPYHSNSVWAEMKADRPDEFADACDFDDAMRSARPGYTTYLHSARIPLRQVGVSTAEQRGQLSFVDECTGMCGV